MGKIVVSRLVKCEKDAISGKTALLYSGGVDSTYTMCTHIKEYPNLIAIWGSDVKYSNKEGWNIIFEQLQDTAKRFELLYYISEVVSATLMMKEHCIEAFQSNLKVDGGME